jgi:protein-S-isoprenylcysteine O-methyltransferase Ste14
MLSIITNFTDQLPSILSIPLPFTIWPIPFAAPFWLIYAWSRHGERKVLFRGQSEDNADQGSWAVINYGSKLARIAAVAVAFITPPWVEGVARLWLYGLGLLLMVAGASLRRHCFKSLGDFFTFQVTAPDTHQIIRHGIYKWVRHPSYTGGMLFNIGIGVAMTNIMSILFLTLTMIMVYIYRVIVEEKALIKAHGNEYTDYMQQTKRFVPFMF